MQQAITLGCAVQCTDSRAGIVSRMVFNPNTNHLDYLVVRAEAGGVEHFVPVRCVLDSRADAVVVCVSAGELRDLPLVGTAPQSPTEGTVHANLDDLCVAGEGTAVVDQEGNQFGQFHGALIDANDDVQGVFLVGQDTPIGIAGIAPQARDTLIVYRAREAAA